MEIGSEFGITTLAIIKSVGCIVLKIVLKCTKCFNRSIK